jgi:TonB family protein
VTLRIYIDSNGAIVADSTRVAETSGFSALDSAAMKGSRDLKFDPAKTRGQPVPVSILLPVFFRHPDAPPLAGDSIIKRDSMAPSATVAPPVDTAKPVVAPKPAAKKPVVRKTTKRRTTR